MNIALKDRVALVAGGSPGIVRGNGEAPRRLWCGGEVFHTHYAAPKEEG